MLRSRAKWKAKGEKKTNYFCGLEKMNYISKQLVKLLDKKGDMSTGTRDIGYEVKKI